MSDAPTDAAASTRAPREESTRQDDPRAEVARLEDLLRARSIEVRDLLAELARVRGLLVDALDRFPGGAGERSLRGELAGLRARVGEAELALRALRRVATSATTRAAAARDALASARTALAEVSAAIEAVGDPAGAAGDDFHDTIPGLSLPELESSR